MSNLNLEVCATGSQIGVSAKILQIILQYIF